MARRVYTADDRANVYMLLTINEGNVKRTSRESGVPEQTVRDWKREFETTGAPPEVAEIAEKAAVDFAAKADALRDLAMDKLEQAIKAGEAKPKDLIVAIGVLSDKARAARGLELTAPQTPQITFNVEQLAIDLAHFARDAVEAARDRDADIIEVTDHKEHPVLELPAATPTKE